MKRTIEIDDTLADRVESAIDDLRDALLRHCAENSCDEAPNIDVFGYQLHEIAYGAVPASYSELRGIWYLYEWELLASYKNAGIGNNPRENDGMAAIYCYILRQCEEWYEDNAEEVVEEFLAGLVADKQIQHNASGVGNDWRNVRREDLNPDVALEIECEIIDGDKDRCQLYVASNGLHYRWGE